MYSNNFAKSFPSSPLLGYDYLKSDISTSRASSSSCTKIGPATRLVLGWLNLAHTSLCRFQVDFREISCATQNPA